MFVSQSNAQLSIFTVDNRMYVVCARLAQLVRSLTANQKVPGSIPGLVEG